MTQPWEQQGSRPYGGDGSGYGSDNLPDVYGGYGSSEGYGSYTGSTPYGDYGGVGDFGGLTAWAYQQYEQQSGGQMEPYRPQPQQGYGQPQQGYGQPAQGYGQPQPGYPPPQGYTTQQVVMAAPQKSAAVAGLLAFFFGPLGMLYSTVTGAVVMFLINIVTIWFTAGIILFLTIPAGTVWAIVAANNHNARTTMMTTTTTYR